MPDLDLSITICSWNTISDLRACLASLEGARTEANCEVIVVDNASFDGSPDMVEAEFPWVTLFRQNVNLGFTGGHNLAISCRNGRHVALLNSDTIVHPGAIKALTSILNAEGNVGIIGPKLLNPDGTLQYSCRRFPNPLAAAFRNTILGRLFPNNPYTRDYLMRDWDHNETREVDWLSGAAMFIHEDVIKQVGVLDNNLFMYCEDVDLCKRAWKAGFKVMYIPDAVITHAIGRSTDRVANKMIVRFHQSMLRYYRKHTVKESPLFFRPFLVILAAFALTLRASAFLGKNYLDAVRRQFK